MLIRNPRGWELPERAVTPEALAVGRRHFVAGAAALGLASPAARADTPPPFTPDPRFPPGRALTAEKDAETYNNYYEFSDDKDLWEDAKSLPLRPWTIAVDGMVAKPQTFAIDDILNKMPQEERIYRHRCVEAWAMTVPWTGFPLRRLLAAVEPLGSAKYVVFQTAMLPKVMPGLSQPW